jgi:predicted nucleic acid-binding protein
MPGVFLDSSAIYAAVDRRERDHEACRREYDRVVNGRVPLMTTELVVAELHALALRRANPSVALAIAERIVRSHRIRIVTPGPDRIEAALALLQSRPGRPYSLADAVAFLVIQEFGLTTVFTLDGDFAAEGFTVVPEPVAGR